MRFAAVGFTCIDVYKNLNISYPTGNGIDLMFNLMDLVQVSDINKNLFILLGGAVPPNPTELLARDGLEKAIDTLKKNFDYVILDTAPVGTQ